MRRDDMRLRHLTPPQVVDSAREALAYRRSWFKLLTSLVLTVIAVVFIFNLVLGLAIVRGDSMRPALREWDLMLYSRLGGEWRRGDIVSLQTENTYFSKYVKRIVGLPGETVDISDDGFVLIDGVAIDEPYVYSTTHPMEEIPFPLTLRAGEYFVLGDNREHSRDSRSIGTVKRAEIHGKILFVFRTGKGF